eukprot:2469545-Rhodomonas_salina.1
MSGECSFAGSGLSCRSVPGLCCARPLQHSAAVLTLARALQFYGPNFAQMMFLMAAALWSFETMGQLFSIVFKNPLLGPLRLLSATACSSLTRSLSSSSLSCLPPSPPLSLCSLILFILLILCVLRLTPHARSAGMLLYLCMWFSSFLFAGIMVPEKDVIWPFRVFAYVLPLRWCLASMAYIEFADVDYEGGDCEPGLGCYGTDGKEVLDSLGLQFQSISSDDNVARDIGYLVLPGPCLLAASLRVTGCICAVSLARLRCCGGDRHVLEAVLLRAALAQDDLDGRAQAVVDLVERALQPPKACQRQPLPGRRPEVSTRRYPNSKLWRGRRHRSNSGTGGLGWAVGGLGTFLASVVPATCSLAPLCSPSRFLSLARSTPAPGLPTNPTSLSVARSHHVRTPSLHPPSCVARFSSSAGQQTEERARKPLRRGRRGHGRRRCGGGGASGGVGERGQEAEGGRWHWSERTGKAGPWAG